LGDRRRSLLVGGLTAIGVVLAIVLIDSTAELTSVVLRVALVFASVALGDMVRSRLALREAARERERLAEREREEQRRRRALDERRGIAQELHDTLAHSLVAINVRAGVAVDLADAQDPQVALHDIKQVSAAALHDLRATLDLLRDRDEGAPTAPAPDLKALPDLVGQVNAAGLRTELELDINGHAIPSAIGAAAFRIVQEALTNVLRHADASIAQVRVRAIDALEIEVSDDGEADSAEASAGLGLAGMNERSTALGGRLDAGPRRDGGWRVHAELPLDGGAHE
jgi:signal transduction histidine kinase